MPNANCNEIPINVVGSSSFGRYKKISDERTYNMFESDGWLVNYAGFQRVTEYFGQQKGRGLFRSFRGNFVIAVIGSGVYRFNTNFAPLFLGSLDTQSGNVSIDENLSSQIAIADGSDIWIYSYVTGLLTKQTLTYLGNPIIPSYVSYHNSYFLISSTVNSDNSQNWYIYEFATDDTIQFVQQRSIQTKPDSAVAVVRLPGRGNNVLALGLSVGEIWTQVASDEVYRRTQSFNIDTGVVSVATIAANEEIVAWIGQNEKNAPSIVITDGTNVKRISTDGIDYLLQTIQHPEQSAAFFFQQDGHLFYQFTFYNPDDNISMIYDVRLDKFYHVSDEDLNFHPARHVIFFNEKVYFVSLNDAAIYEMSTDYITYDYDTDPTSTGFVIPRYRICKTVRLANSMRFRPWDFVFLIEQGTDKTYLINPDTIRCDGQLITEDSQYDIVTEMGDILLAEYGHCFSIAQRPRVDMSFSKDGNQSYSNIVGKTLNTLGHYKNILRWTGSKGECNEFTIKLRFIGFQRFVVQNGVLMVQEL